jgi:hypothetical protein
VPAESDIRSSWRAVGLVRACERSAMAQPVSGEHAVSATQCLSSSSPAGIVFHDAMGYQRRGHCSDVARCFT